ncbi:peritrophin-1-like [Limulus polyphemus]|uniref:Peritrophin-1-like n=1 Tax=Limulus polyphemus TaxID=6850 RepID=A0ABM1B0H9_LIMPO|nr:peritrophin-1-like [Limulus polyphemus]
MFFIYLRLILCLVLRFYVIQVMAGYEVKTDTHGYVIFCGEQSPCINPNGLNANPNDCCSFFNCYNCTSYFLKCPSGLHFNLKRNTCDWPHQADCRAQNTYCHQK